MVYCIDTETTGLKHAHGDRAFLITYSDSAGVVRVAYPTDVSSVRELSLREGAEFVGHNIGFDIPFLADFDILLPVVHDTMIMAHVFNNIEEAKDLSSLALKYCGMSNPEEEKLEEWFVLNRVAKDKRRYDQVPLDIMVPYALADIRMTQALFEFYKSNGILDSQAYKAEMNVLPCVVDIGQTGMRVDQAYASTELDKAIIRIVDLEREALDTYGVSNLGSTDELADLMFTKDGLTCTTTTPKGNISLDVNALKKYDHKIIPIVEEYRELSKLSSTYLEAICKLAHNGRLYSKLNQVGARTSRFSCDSPNLQNIPRSGADSLINLRRAFICEEDCELLLIDLSQIELRILAHYAKEPAMIETLTDRKGDLHARTAQEMFGEVNKRYRTVAKTINFGIVYGAGAAVLVEQINKALPDAHIDLKQASQFKSKYFNAFANVKAFLWEVQKRIAISGYVFGRSERKYYCDKTKAYRASNYLIQGESAMLMKDMMSEIHTYLKGRKTKMINVIHDEFIFQLHKSEKHIIPDLTQIIERDRGWRVPIFCNVEISATSWADKKPFIPTEASAQTPCYPV